jgi:alanyl-tRNA synthetase
MQRQKARARANWSGSGQQGQAGEWAAIRSATKPTRFVGYETREGAAEVVAIVAHGAAVDSAGLDEEVEVVFDQTPFYGESGGQAGDTGTVEWPGGSAVVRDTKKVGGDVHLHHLRVVRGVLAVGASVRLAVDADLRTRTRANHSATHLLHAALRNVLGSHVAQKGQHVDAERIRFDFAHSGPLTSEELDRIEAEVNTVIRQNAPAQTKDMAPEEAIRAGAMALFGEKYGDTVRVLTLGQELGGDRPYSVELCGGTHVSRTGDIALFKIISETGVSAGVRRIEALTGEAARRYLLAQAEIASDVAGLFKVPASEVRSRVEALIEHGRRTERELAAAKKQLAMGGGSPSGDAQIEDVAGLQFLHRRLDETGAKELRPILEDLKKQVSDGVVALAGVMDGKVAFAVGVTGAALERYSAVDLVRAAVETAGGQGGGGRRDFAQGGAPTSARADQGLVAVKDALAR